MFGRGLPTAAFDSDEDDEDVAAVGVNSVQTAAPAMSPQLSEAEFFENPNALNLMMDQAMARARKASASSATEEANIVQKTSSSSLFGRGMPTTAFDSDSGDDEAEDAEEIRSAGPREEVASQAAAIEETGVPPEQAAEPTVVSVAIAPPAATITGPTLPEAVDKLLGFFGVGTDGFLSGAQLQPVMMKCNPPVAKDMLGKIWSATDTKSEGKLDKVLLMKLLGLISQAQTDGLPNPQLLSLTTPPPKITGLTC